MKASPNQITAANAGWRSRIRVRGSRDLPGVAELDFLIEQLRTERDSFIHQLVEGSRRIGELETELRQLNAPRNDLESGQ
jgi:hypothetical protein